MGKMMEAAPRRQEMRDEDLLRQVLQPDFGQMHVRVNVQKSAIPLSYSRKLSSQAIC